MPLHEIIAFSALAIMIAALFAGSMYRRRTERFLIKIALALFFLWPLTFMATRLLEIPELYVR